MAWIKNNFYIEKIDIELISRNQVMISDKGGKSILIESDKDGEIHHEKVH